MNLLKQNGFVLPSFGMQLAIVGIVIVATNLFTAIKVADYVQDQNDLQNLKAEVVIVEREKEVQVLDKRTLDEALGRQKRRFEDELQNERFINAILQARINSGEPWCELNADELRVWNAENSGRLIDDDKRTALEGGRTLPEGATPGKGRDNSRPVAQ